MHHGDHLVRTGRCCRRRVVVTTLTAAAAIITFITTVIILWAARLVVINESSSDVGARELRPINVVIRRVERQRRGLRDSGSRKRAARGP